jgi:hypothetical protein
MIVPQAMGRWMRTNHYDNIPSSSSVFPNSSFSLLQSSADENQFDLIKLTIQHYNPHLDDATQKEIISVIMEASNENNLDPFLITAVIAAESSFKPKAKSHCGARGLMQLTRVVLPSLGVNDPFDIEENIHGGCKFLSELYQRFGNTTLALAAYNAGPTRVARLKRVPRIRETQKYVEKVQWIAAVLLDNLLTAIETKTVNPIVYITNLSFKHHYRPTTLNIVSELNQYSLVLHKTNFTSGYIPVDLSKPVQLISTKQGTGLFPTGQWSYLG